MVKKAAMEIKGAPGPSGMDANAWRMLLISKRNSTAAADLCKAVAKLAQKMRYKNCQHLEVLIYCRLIPLKNQNNDVRLIGIGEVLRRIISKCIMKTAREDTMKTVGNLQLCARQQAGAEEAVLAAKEIFANKECEAVLFVDASNAFLKYQTAKTENNAGLNVSALGFWCRDQKAFFDIRVFDLVAPSHAHHSLDAAHSKQENEKHRQYEDRILHVEYASFTLLVFTIAGGMSKCTKKFFNRLGEMLAEKRLQPKSIVSSWIRCRVSFSLLRFAARYL